MRRSILIILALVLKLSFVYSQEKPKRFTLDGYVSTIQSVMFDSLSGPVMTEDYLHNRLNFRAYINDHITFAADARNRLLTGDLVRLGRIYTEIIKNDPGLVSLSWNIIDEQAVLLNTRIDRLWLDLHYNKFQVTLGRQRINWGQTLVWNPNDIFNAYSVFDFDYVERPGSDAVRVQFFPSSSSVLELAAKTDNEHNLTTSGLFRFNAGGYDIQFLAGLVNSADIVIGTGWSGSIGKFSFRGEGSWFQPYEEFPASGGTVLITSGLDRVFKDNSMALIQLMYCNHPLSITSFYGFYAGTLSAKDLAFSRFSAFGQFDWAITPLISLDLSGMWFPDLSGYYAGPTFNISLADNVDMSVIWQHFNAIMIGEKTEINLGFLRLKYSF